MSPRSILVTGCNRGIGLEFVRQFLARSPSPKHIFATYRDPNTASDLLSLASNSPILHPIQFEVTDTASYPALCNQITETVGEDGLNLVINNAGIKPVPGDLQSIRPEAMLSAFQTNCVAPLFLSRALLPLLQIAANKESGKKLGVERAAIVQISAIIASVANTAATGGGMYPYRCSKTALNMAMKSMAVDLKNTGILTLAIHPGWVKTNMGGEGAMITTVESTTAILATLAQASAKEHGALLNYDGKPMEW